jgi:hypothetical protein
MPAILLQSLLGFEPHDGQRITGVLVGVDDPRRGLRDWDEAELARLAL